MKESNDAYHADTSRISNSMLSVLKRSPLEFKERFIDKTWEKEDSKALRIGTMVHCLVLEHAEFDNRYIVAEKHDKRTKEGKAAAEAYELKANGREIINSDEMLTAYECAKSIMAHGEIATLLSTLPSDAMTEERIDFEMFGVQCKCKPDLLIPSKGLILDIKTTQDASPVEFARSVAKFGYARQCAFYSEAARQKYGCDFRFILCVASTSKPYEKACYELSGQSVDTGMSEISVLLSDYQRRKESNDWEAPWSKGIVSLDLPKYYSSSVFTE